MNLINLINEGLTTDRVTELGIILRHVYVWAKLC